MKSEDLRSEHTAGTLLYAAAMKFREEGNEQCAKLLQEIFKQPKEAGDILKLIKKTEKERKAIKLTGVEAVALIVEADLGKAQYLKLRAVAKEHNADIFPAYETVLEAKKLSCPPKEALLITEQSGEVGLQSLLDHDAARVVEVLQAKSPELLDNIPPLSDLEFEHKWGVDGSSGHSQYKQGFEDDSESDDRYVLLTAMSPLQLRVRGSEEVLWTNPTPSSTKYCKPIRIQMKKETTQSLKEEEEYILAQAASLVPSEVCTKSGKSFKVHHTLKMTMIDGKTRSILTDTATSTCSVCGAPPSQMSVDSVMRRPIDVSALKYGISVLHARIRMLECILHIAYRMEEKKWRVSAEKISARKRRIQDQLWEKLKIRVDVVKPGAGTTNDGNTARRFFACSEEVAEILEVDESLIKRFAVIQDVLASGFQINVEKFRNYCLETARYYENMYGWFYMPASIHLILIHGADIMANLQLPVGMYSEEALESRNKHVRSFRELRTRKISRLATMEDLFGRLLLTGDILLASLRKEKLCARIFDFREELQDLIIE